MFETYLVEQLSKHPSMQPQDVVKMCYQAAFGAEHLLTDATAAWQYLEREFASVQAGDGPLYERISDEICRVNLSAWKAEALPLQWLFRMFLGSAHICEDAEDRFRDLVAAAETVVHNQKTSFSEEEWAAYCSQYQKSGICPVHHSEKYRNAERPAYRVVSRRYLRLLPVLQAAARKAAADTITVIAIDGRAASGKSTMAGQLKDILDADVIRMDDFFLPPALRTQERFAEPGGNVHYERFAGEVLPHIKVPKPFSYRVFDCGSMDYNGVKQIGTKGFRVVEGSYSTHPRFGAYADISVFATVSQGEQLRRIRMRNGAQMLQSFQSRWIPLEEMYFSYYDIQEKADLVITEASGI